MNRRVRAPRLNSPLGVTLCCLVAVALSTGVRLVVLPEWLRPGLSVNGQPIQFTPDAYHWLSGSIGLGPAVDNPMSLMLRFLSPLVGQTPDLVAFMLPALLGSLGAVGLILWGRLLGSTAAGLAAGLVTVLTPAYYGRTQLGQLDTDFATLLFPCLAGWMLAHFCRDFLELPWLWQGVRFPVPRRKKAAEKAPDQAMATGGMEKDAAPKTSLARALVLALLTGAALQFFGLWHPRIGSYNELALYLTAALALVSRSGERKAQSFWALTMLGLAALHGLYGLAGALALCLALCFAPKARALAGRRAWPGVLALALVLGGCFLRSESLTSMVWIYVEKFLTPLAHAAAREITLPSVTVTVAEEVKSAQAYLLLIHKYFWLIPVGYLGFLFCLLRRPVLVYLLPLGVLSLSGPLVGARLAMFSAPILGLGLSLPLAWGVQRLLRPGKWRAALMATLLAGLVALFVGPYLREYVTLPAKPVLSRGHGQLLSALRRGTPKPAWVWNEWVYGYATRYYSRRNILLDGGVNRGSNGVYVLSRIYMARDPKLAAGLMLTMADVSFDLPRFWEGVASGKVQDSITALAHGKHGKKSEKLPQYLVVSVDHLALLRWIYYFASWDFEQNKGRFPVFRQLTQRLSVQLDEGVVLLHGPAGVQRLRFDTIDIVSRRGQQHRSFKVGNGLHLLLQAGGKGQAFVMNNEVYNSMLVQLLINKELPRKIGKRFEVAVDFYPEARALRLK